MATSAVSILDDDGSVFSDELIGEQRTAFKVSTDLVALFTKILEVTTEKKSLAQVATAFDEIKKVRAAEEIQQQLQLSEKQKEAVPGQTAEPKASSFPWWFVTGAIDATKSAISKTIGAVASASSAAAKPDSTVGMDFKFDHDKDAKLANISLPTLDLIELYGIMCSFYFSASAERAKLSATADKTLLASATTTAVDAAVAELVSETTFGPFVAAILNRVSSETDQATIISSLWHYLTQLSLFKHILTGTLPSPLPVGESSHHHSHGHKHTQDSSAKTSHGPVPYGAYLLPLRTNTDDALHLGLIAGKVTALAKHLCPSISSDLSQSPSIDDLIVGLKKLSETIPPPATGSIVAAATSFILQHSSHEQHRAISVKPIHGELSIEEATKARCSDFVYLPPNYHAFIHTATTLQNCSACGASNCSMMCLKCRALLCLRAKPKPEAVFHSQTCGCGVGMFLLLKGSAFVVVSGVTERATQNNPVYVDKFGEFDNGLRRGVALTLSKYVASDLLVPLITNTWDHDTNSLKNAFRNGVTTL